MLEPLWCFRCLNCKPAAYNTCLLNNELGCSLIPHTQRQLYPKGSSIPLQGGVEKTSSYAAPGKSDGVTAPSQPL
jgi:hypothetical protein